MHIGRGWARRSRRSRREHEDGHLDWLLELAARRMPTGGKKGGVSEWTGVDGGDQDWLLDFASRTVPEAQTSTATVTRKRTIRR